MISADPRKSRHDRRGSEAYQVVRAAASMSSWHVSLISGWVRSTLMLVVCVKDRYKKRTPDKSYCILETQRLWLALS